MKGIHQKYPVGMFLFFLIALLLSGCSSTEEEITGIVFERGHGSAWGNQFYIHLTSKEIVDATYIPEGSSDLVPVEHIPITDSQWQTVHAMVTQLPLEKARTDLFKKHKLDGGAFRKLTLIHGEKETEYRWPNVPEAQQLEQFFETLLTDSIEPKAQDTETFSAAVPIG